MEIKQSKEESAAKANLLSSAIERMFVRYKTNNNELKKYKVTHGMLLKFQDYKNQVFTSTYGGRSFLFAATKEESNWSVKESWNNKAQGYMSSPLIINGHIYVHLRNQRFACMNLQSGESNWTTTPFGKYWSTVTDGEKILALDEKGELLLIQADPQEFKLIDRRKVADDSWAHIAVAGNEIFVRALDGISAYRWKAN